MYTILLSKFIEILDVAKLAKPHTVLVDKYNIYDIDTCFIKRINNVEGLDMYLMFEYKHAMDMIKTIAVVVDLTVTIDIKSMRLYLTMNPATFINIYNPNVALSVIANVMSDLQRATYIPYGEVQNDEDFIKSNTVRPAEESVGLYIKDDYPMTIFKGVLPVNKSDKVSLTIYDLDYYNFLSMFTTYKKKGITIDMIIRNMKLRVV